jgi:hypothetical protein
MVAVMRKIKEREMAKVKNADSKDTVQVEKTTKVLSILSK